jgi:hypothetical protein
MVFGGKICSGDRKHLLLIYLPAQTHSLSFQSADTSAEPPSKDSAHIACFRQLCHEWRGQLHFRLCHSVMPRVTSSCKGKVKHWRQRPYPCHQLGPLRRWGWRPLKAHNWWRPEQCPQSLWLFPVTSQEWHS